jgi:hypothetical protein
MTGRPRSPKSGEPPDPRQRDSGAPLGPRPYAVRSVADAQDAIAELARAGRPREVNGSPRTTSRGTDSDATGELAEGGVVRFHGGHTTRPRAILDLERQEKWAVNAYDDIRAHPDTDVIAGSLRLTDRLDGSAGFTVEEIARVRRQIFFDEHPLSDYEGGVVHRRYDPSPEMAEAWLRLRAGRALPEDVALVEHELAEARYYDAHPGAGYREAHRAANGVSNWQNRIPAPTYEDYSTPWR